MADEKRQSPGQVKYTDQKPKLRPPVGAPMDLKKVQGRPKPATTETKP